MTPRQGRRLTWGLVLVCLVVGVDLVLGRAVYGASLRVMNVGSLRKRGSSTEFVVGFERPGRYASLSEVFHWQVVEAGSVAFPASAIATFTPGTIVTVAEAAAAQLRRRERRASWLDRVVEDVDGLGTGGGQQAPVRPDVLRIPR